MFVARTPSKSTTNGGNYHTSTVQLHGDDPSHLSESHVSLVSFLTLEKHRNVPLHQINTFTKFDGRGAYHF